MLRRTAVWLLYSPRRLALLLVPLVLAAIVAVALAHGRGQPSHPRQPEARAKPASAPRHPRSSMNRGIERTSSAKPARRAVKEFLRAYVRTPEQTIPSRVDSLRPLVTPTLWKGLRLTDPSALPQGPVVSVSPEGSGSYAAQYVATLRDGRVLDVAAVDWTHGWRVADVRLRGAS